MTKTPPRTTKKPPPYRDGPRAGGAAPPTGVLLVTVSEYTEWLYRGGFLAAASVFALVVAATTHPASPLGPALDNPVMRWIGERSYGIYLYHWPIFLVTRPGLDGPWNNAVRVALVLAAAELSYRFVEVPVRRGVFGAWAHRRRVWAVAVPTAAVLGVLLATAPAPSARDFAPVTAVRDGARLVAGSVAAADAAPAIAWYGDSVSLWASDTLLREFPGAVIDAQNNRAPTNILHQVQQDRPGGTVVMHLGNAGPVSASQLRRTLSMLGEAERVVLINSNAGFAYVPQANRTIDDVAAEFARAVVLDWEGLSEGREEWFSDGLHLTQAGQQAYAEAVRGAIEG